MARYRTTLPCPAPAPVAYRYLVDFANIADWDPGVAEAELASGGSGEVGSEYLVQVTFLGRRTPMTYRMVTARRPSTASPGLIEVRAETGDFVSFDVITIDPTASGCNVTYDADLALKGLRRVGDPILQGAFEVIGRRARGGLATALEGLGGSA